jgi:hypothetical protein
MVASGKRSLKKPQAAPEELLPITDKKSPLPDEQPPLPDDEPPVPDEEPPLPNEQPPPLPTEDVPEEQPPLPDEPLFVSSGDSNQVSTGHMTQVAQVTQPEPDAWQAIWEPSANAYYFYNSETHESTWLNPRLPPDEAAAYLAVNPPAYNSNAGHTPGAYGLPQSLPHETVPESVYDPETGEYAFTARFNARTGKFQNNPEHTAENFSTKGQLMREAKEYFDVNVMSQGKIVGQSGGALKADRRGYSKKIKKELIKRGKEKRDRKKREWLANDDVIVRKH